jgi:hypothetical protein
MRIGSRAAAAANRYDFPMNIRTIARIAVAAVATLAATGVMAVCGSLPSSHATYGGGSLQIGNNSTIVDGVGSPDAANVPSGSSGRALNPNGTRTNPSPAPTLPSLEPASFPATGTTNVTVSSAGTSSIASGSYNDITVSNWTAGTDATFATSGGTYYIDKLTINNNATAVFAPGTYFIDELDMGKTGTIAISPAGVVKIFIGDKFEAGNDYKINSGGSVGNFQVFLYPGADAQFGDQSAADSTKDFVGILYAPGSGSDIRFRINTDIQGAVISAGDVQIGNNTDFTYTAADQAAVGGTTTCTAAIHHFTITASTSASTCTPLSVTIAAKDAANATLTGYTGTINISVQSNHGDWSAVAALGTLANGTADDGAASYTFVAGDSGDIVLSLDNRHADDLTITVVDNTLPSTSTTSGTIQFRDNAFVITPTDALGTTVVAGRNHGMKVEMWRKDPSTGVCAIATGYSGNRHLDAWITRDAADPSGTAPTINGVSLPNAAPGGTGVNNLWFGFVFGVVNFNLVTTDVGKYTLNFRDDSRNFATGVDITGSSAALTVRPLGLDIQVTGNPAANTPAGGIFTKAGEDFAATVRGVLWSAADDANNDGVPDAGANLGNNGVTPRYAWATTLTAAAPFTPTGGTLGTLNNGTVAQASFSGGSAAPGNLQYTEVGSFTMNGTASAYLGTPGVDIAGSGGVVGRFTPFDFNAIQNVPSFSTACAAGGFTYIGQPFGYATAPVITLTARNKQGATTRNYTGAWWKITNASLTGKVYTALTGALDTGGLPAPDPIIADTGNGTGTLTFDDGAGLAFSRGSPAAPFDGEIALAINVIDADAIAYGGNPATFGAATAGNGIAFSSGKAMRWGRLALANAYGSELLPLDVPVRAEYFDGGAFITHADDDCTQYSSGATLGNFRGNLAAGETNVIGPAAPVTLVNGRSVPADPLRLSAPGAGNTGSATLTLGTSSWLRYDWDGDAAHDDDPSADVTFGIYAGPSRHIYIREPW